MYSLSMQLKKSDLDQREIALGPDLRQIEGVERESLRLSVRHHLNEERPAREISGLDAFEKIPLMGLAVLADKGLGFGIRQVLDALLGTKVEFDPDAFVCGVEETVCVAAETMHVAETPRNTALAHDNRDLMQCLGQQRPEVPVVVSAAHAGSRITLDGVVEIGKAQRIAE